MYRKRAGSFRGENRRISRWYATGSWTCDRPTCECGREKCGALLGGDTDGVGNGRGDLHMVRRGLGDGEACAFMECVSPSGRGMEVRVLVARVWVAKGCFGGGWLRGCGILELGGK